MVPPANKKAYQPLFDYLHNKSNEQIRTVGIASLRAWHRNDRMIIRMPSADPLDEPAAGIVSMNGDLGIWFARVMRDAQVAVDEHTMKEAFVDAQDRSWMTPIMEFVWWLEAAGLAVLARSPTNVIHQIRMTARGMLLLQADDTDDPLLPGFLWNIQRRCPGLPDGVIAQLEDARACLDHSLNRAAVVLMGVAFETAIAAVVDHLEPLNVLGSKKLRQAGDRITAIRDALAADRIPAIAELEGPAKEAAKSLAADAYDFANQLRLRRNDASHINPLNDFTHRGETEEFLVSAGRHLRGIWLPVGAPEVAEEQLSPI
jgi:hypothetical protein